MKKNVWIINILTVIVLLVVTSVILISCGEPDNAKTTDDKNLNSETSSEKVSSDWCKEHSVPESECTKCDPSLIDSYKASNDWCAGHDLPESHCLLCNPGITFPQEEAMITANTLDDWCAEHKVPESECALCDPSLIDSYKASNDWCAGHGLPESHCRLCNPGITFPQEEAMITANTLNDWCVEHKVPESECALCDPSLIDSYKASNDWCAGHGLPESHCRLCNPGIKFPQEELLQAGELKIQTNDIEISLFFRQNKNICATNDAIIQFASSQTAERAGISVQQTIAAPHEIEITAPAEILFNENSTVVISSSVKVLVSRWLISPGDIVNKGEPIAILQSSEMAELQAKLISTDAELEVQKKELERDKALIAKQLVTSSDYERRIALNKKVQAEMISVRGLLLSSGISNNDIDELLENSTVTNEFVLRSPETGLISNRIAQVGEQLDDGQALAILTDPSSLWIEAQLTETQIKRVYVGQDLHYTSDDAALNRSKGNIIWVSPSLDSHTRTGIVRAQVDNQDHSLRAGEFGQVIIIEPHDAHTILVPKDAVQWEGCCNVVFVKESQDRFRPRKVTLIDGPDSYYQVTDGLSQGEEIVVDGSFLLKTELKKTSIGAGCCDVGPVG